MLPLPAGPHDITAGWLSAVLRDTSDAEQPAVTQVSWETIGEDRGLTGVLARLHLGYERPAEPDPEQKRAPATLIAKFPMASRGAPSVYRERQQSNPSALRQHYARSTREVAFYQQIALLATLPVPRLHYGASDDAQQRVVLLLDDVPAARAGDVLLGCTAPEAAAVLDAVAPLHARWWARQQQTLVAWLPDWVGDPQVRQQRYAQQLGPFLERFGHQLPAPVLDALERLRTGYASVLSALAAAPATLCHADLHLDNVLFMPPSSPTPVVVLDWQSVCWGPAAVDIALFVFGSLAPDERRLAAPDLFARYHTRLTALGVTGYTLPQLREHCRWVLLWQLVGTVGWLSTASVAQLVGREQALVEAALGDGRLVTALLDEDAAALLPP